MNLCSRANTGLVLALAVVMATLVVAERAGAETSVVVQALSGKNVSIVEVEAFQTADGLQIEGALQRRRFSPRRPLRGLVSVVVTDADGQIIREEELQTASRFVPKGIRLAKFNTVLAGAIPQGASVTLRLVY